MLNELTFEQRREKLRRSLVKSRRETAGDDGKPVGPRADDGGAIAVAPGVFRVRLPIDDALDHMNAFVLDDGPGWLIVDPGPCSDPVRRKWDRLLAGPLAGKPVRRVLCTHHHADHTGLAGGMVRRDGAEFLTTAGEWDCYVRLWRPDCPERQAAWLSFFAHAGLTPAGLAARDWDRSPPIEAEPPPDTFTRLADGDWLTIGGRLWRVLAGGGHTPEHLCLYRPEDGALIGGDHTLAGLATSVTPVLFDPGRDCIGAFLATTGQLLTLPRDSLVLPGHGGAYRDLHGALRDSRARIQARLEAVAVSCTAPVTAASLADRMSMAAADATEAYLKIGEALAALNHLAVVGRLSVEPGVTGPHFVRRN
jgi:glyoxylase-like metal-dependent hydrolase (beta-lactamase superfamily II)